MKRECEKNNINHQSSPLAYRRHLSFTVLALTVLRVVETLHLLVLLICRTLKNSIHTQRVTVMILYTLIFYI